MLYPQGVQSVLDLCNSYTGRQDHFLIWVLRPFQEYFSYIESIVHERRAITQEPGEKPPDHP